MIGSRTIHYVEYKGDEYETTFAPEDTCFDPHIVELPAGRLEVTYCVAADHCAPNDPLEENDSVSVLWFRNGQERDEWLDENKAEYLRDKYSFLIKRYSHGLDHYSTLEGGRNYPDAQWDVASGVGVITLSTQTWPDEDEEMLRTVANQLLDEYSSWCNGDVWGVVQEVFSLADQAQVSEDDVWGIIGSKWAKEYAESLVTKN